MTVSLTAYINALSDDHRLSCCYCNELWNCCVDGGGGLFATSECIQSSCCSLSV